MLDDITDKLVAEVLMDVNLEVLDSWVNSHALIDLQEEEGRE